MSLRLDNQTIESIKKSGLVGMLHGIGLHNTIYLKLSKKSGKKGQTLMKGRAFQNNSP